MLVDTPTLPRYVASVVEDLASSPSARLVVLAALPPIARGWREQLRRWPLAGFQTLDRRAGGPVDPLAPVSSAEVLPEVARLDAHWDQDEPHSLASASLEALRGLDLDVLVRLCTAELRGLPPGVARHGVWSFHYGSDLDSSVEPFFEQHARAEATRDVRLQADTERGLRVLHRATFAGGGNVFLPESRRAAIWETTHLLTRKLDELHERGATDASGEHRPETAVPPPSTRSPGAGAVLRHVVPRLAAGLVNRLRAWPRADNPWMIGLRRTRSPFGGTRDATRIDDFRWSGQDGHTWADPFLFTRDGATLVFFEDYDFSQDYGVIRCAEVREDCTLGPPMLCLDPGYHLSFPFVFEDGGEIFMIPESLADGTVTLYRARRYPADWVAEKVLFRGNAADTVLWTDEGRYFFLTTLHDRDDRGMTEMLFEADSLTAPWRLHPASPISCDVRSARNAGAMFRRDGRLFRATQDCSAAYGYALGLQEVVTMDATRYEERPWCSVTPDALPFPCLGVHTYNASGDLEAIDCHRPGPRSRGKAVAHLLRGRG